MKAIILLAICPILVAVPSFSQGVFNFYNYYAPTRLWTIDGPLAGRGIWAQMLAGPNTDSLAPVGGAYEHLANGLVYGGIVTVPGIPEFEGAYIQMVAWDGRLWGTNLIAVPADQIGSTDTTVLVLGGSIVPAGVPHFMQPAIVPIPEPSVLALTVLAGAALFMCRRLWHRTRHPR